MRQLRLAFILMTFLLNASGTRLTMPGGQIVAATRAPEGVLDVQSTLAAYYTLRDPGGSYAGSLVRLRRSSDNTENDFGWKQNGDFDTTSAQAFAGAGDLYVVTWYDASGNGRNATQATTAAQPQFILSGQNGRPTLRFDGSDDQLVGSYSLSQPTTIIIAGKTTSTDTNHFIDSATNRQVLGSLSNKLILYAGTTLSDTATNLLSFQIASGIFSGSGSRLYKNSRLIASGQGGSSGLDNPTIGGTATDKLQGDLAEVVIAAETLSASKIREIENNINRAYRIWIWNYQDIVMQGSAGGENGQVGEPTVIYEGSAQILSGNVYKMWYSGGDSPTNIYYAESYDGVTWTKRGTEVVASHARGAVLHDGSTYYLYCVPPAADKINLYTSADGVSFTLNTAGVVTLGGVGTWDATAFGNPWVWKEGASDWRMLYEAKTSVGGGIWKVGYATSSDGTTWTKHASNPVVSSAGMRGGPNLLKSGSTYFLVVQGAASDVLPTDLYFYTSTDLITWTAAPDFIGFERNTSDEGAGTSVGQVADATMLEVNGQVWMWYAPGIDGSTPAFGNSKIALAIADTSLANLITLFAGRH